jgi:hypothetical protein
MLDDVALVRLGNAEQHPDHLHRHLRAEVGDEVEPPGADQRIEAACGEFADLRFQRSDFARGEDPGEQFAVVLWIGGSSKMRVPDGISMPDWMISSTAPRAELNVS